MSIGERIKMARLMAGQSQRDLAQRAGVSAMAVSKYERDMDIPGSPVLVGLAKALGQPVEFLFRPATVRLQSVNYRCRPPLSAPSRQRIQAEAQEWLERYIEAEALAGSSRRFVYPPIERKMVDITEVERAAEQLRDAWHLGHDPIDSMVDMLQDHGLPVGLVRGHDAFDALTFQQEDLGPVIVLKADLPGDRQRFSLAHELGHILLQPEAGLDVELAVNRFAGALLVPKAAALRELGEHRKHLGIQELELLKTKYGLSMLGWVHRAEDLGIISRHSASELRRQFTSHGWDREEPGRPVPSEEPTALRMFVYRALSEEAISRPRAAELLGETIASGLRGI